jgi:hypothetical protein
VTKNWIILFFFFSSFGGAYGQETVWGVVRDAETGEPLVAATLQIVGTSRGVITGQEGEYEIELVAVPAVVRVSHIGYDSVEVVVGEVAEKGRDILLEPVSYAADLVRQFGYYRH